MAIDTDLIARLTASVSDLARADVSDMSHDSLVAAQEAVATLGKVTDVLRARFAGEIAARSKPQMNGGGLARSAGHGDAGKMISRVSGGSYAGAKRAIEAGGALVSEVERDPRTGRAVVADACLGQVPAAPRFPVLVEAAVVGELSVDAVGLIRTGLDTVAERVPDQTLHEMERVLVARAQGLTASEVRRMVSRAVARVDRQGHQERERRNHAERFLTWKEDHTGMVTFSGRLDAVTAAPIRTTIEQMVTAQFRARRDSVYGAGDSSEAGQRTVGQMRADALSEICRHALGCKDTDKSGIRTTVVVRMNLSDLNANAGLGSIDGTEALVSVPQLRRLAGDAGMMPEVLDGDGHVLDLGRTSRYFSGAQRIALLERDGGCAKCHAPPEHCEAHHIRWWQHGGRTDLSNGVMLCTRCHHDVHRQGWEIMVHQNSVEFIPPPDIDYQQRPRPGGIAALEAGQIGPPTDRDGFPYPGDDFFVDDEDMIRTWERNAALLPQ